MDRLKLSRTAKEAGGTFGTLGDLLRKAEADVMPDGATKVEVEVITDAALCGVIREAGSSVIVLIGAERILPGDADIVAKLGAYTAAWTAHEVKGKVYVLATSDAIECSWKDKSPTMAAGNDKDLCDGWKDAGAASYTGLDEFIAKVLNGGEESIKVRYTESEKVPAKFISAWISKSSSAQLLPSRPDVSTFSQPRLAFSMLLAVVSWEKSAERPRRLYLNPPPKVPRVLLFPPLHLAAQKEKYEKREEGERASPSMWSTSPPVRLSTWSAGPGLTVFHPLLLSLASPSSHSPEAEPTITRSKTKSKQRAGMQGGYYQDQAYAGGYGGPGPSQPPPPSHSYSYRNSGPWDQPPQDPRYHQEAAYASRGYAPPPPPLPQLQYSPPDEFRAPDNVGTDVNAFARFFSHHLGTLSFNSKPVITNLTLFAHQHLLRMSSIVASCLDDHLRLVSPSLLVGGGS